MSYPPGVIMPPQQQQQNGQPQQQQPVQQPLPPQGMPQNYGFQQPQAPPQPQGPPRFTPSGDEILDGPTVPAELRGRKFSDVMRLYGGLADDFIKRSRPREGQNPQQPQQPPQQQAAVQNPLPQQGQGNSFWQNPDESLKTIVQNVVQESLQPFQQRTLESDTRAAREKASQEIPDFRDLEPDIMDIVKGSSAESLASLEYWQHAADLARGRRARASLTQPNQPQPPQQPPVALGNLNQNPFNQYQSQYQQPQPQGFPQPAMPQHLGQQNPFGQPQMPQMQRPHPSQFFTEAPTAPSVLQNTHMGALSQTQLAVAKAAGMTPEQYSAWAAIQERGK